jgi:hypothetical protein
LLNFKAQIPDNKKSEQHMRVDCSEFLLSILEAAQRFGKENRLFLSPIRLFCFNPLSADAGQFDAVMAESI